MAMAAPIPMTTEHRIIMTDTHRQRRSFFAPQRKDYSDEQTRVYADWEIAYTCVDFLAALTFLVGSVMFLSEEWTTFGTWLFIFGSICFALKPTIRLTREVHLMRIDDPGEVAKKLDV